MNRKTISLAVVCLLIAALAIFAQTTNSITISGTITTLSGAPVATAAIAVTNTANNQTVRALSGQDGTFSFTGLTPGTYTLVVEMAGFKRVAHPNIVLTGAVTQVINITLEAGSAAETVELTGETPAVNTQTGEMGRGIDMREIAELPVIDRNNMQLVELQTGITPPEAVLPMTQDPERNRFFSATGQNPLFNMFSFDGSSNWEPQQGMQIRVQPNAIMQQLNVVTSNYTENQGLAGGAIVHNLTRAGTNNWHGDFFEFWNGSILNTRSAIDTLSSSGPRFVYNQPGGAIGGAIVKDKTFVFGGFEGTYINGRTLDLTTVPTAAAAAGDFSGIPGLTVYNPATGVNGAGRTPFAGNVIPSADLNPTALALSAALPSPNLPGLYNNLLATPFDYTHNNKYDGRLDQNFTDRTKAYLRFGFSNDWARADSALAPVGATTNTHLKAYNAAIDLIHQFSPGLIADARFGYNRYDSFINNTNMSPFLPGALTPFAFSPASIDISGMEPIGAASYLPENGRDNTFQWRTNWNLITSNHHVTWGVDIRRIRSDGFTQTPFETQFGPGGSFVFGPGATLTSEAPGAFSPFTQFYNSYAAFLTGAPTAAGISDFFTQPSIRQTQYGAWLGDTLQFFGRLTIDIGVRYDVFSPLGTSFAGGAAFFNPSTNSYLFGSTANNYDLDNVAPRFGYAFRVARNTVIRGGYGISYFQTPYAYTGFMAPQFGSVTGAVGGFGVAPLSTPFDGTLTNTASVPNLTGPGAATGNLPATVIPSNLQTPYVQNYSTELQQGTYWGMLLTVGYVGSVGRHLPYIQELNASLPGTGLAGLPFDAFGRTASTLLFSNGINDNYNSLQVKLGKRFSKGLSFSAGYTWAKALGYTNENLLLLNPFNLQSNYGPQDWDRQSVLTVSHLWVLPWGRNGRTLLSTFLGGWQANGIFNWFTGTPLTITSDPTTCGCVGFTPGVNFTGSSPNLSGVGNFVLNPAAFSVAAPGTFGSLGRGAIRGPSTTNYDFSLFKNFRVLERFNLQLRGEAYNLLNSKQFVNPITNLSSPGFGAINATNLGAFGRRVNLALRVTF